MSSVVFALLGCARSGPEELGTSADAGARGFVSRDASTVNAARCVPGRVLDCHCRGGASGVQVCDARGERFSSCDCGGVAGDASADAAVRAFIDGGDRSETALQDGSPPGPLLDAAGSDRPTSSSEDEEAEASPPSGTLTGDGVSGESSTGETTTGETTTSESGEAMTDESAAEGDAEGDAGMVAIEVTPSPSLDNPCEDVVGESCVRYVSPYVVPADRAGRVIVRGEQLSALTGDPTVILGQTELGTVSVADGRQFFLDFPALSPGRYVISLKTEDGEMPSNAELVVVESTDFGDEDISASGLRSRLVYDAERQTLYALNRFDQAIERYAFDGEWSTLEPLVMVQLQDIAVGPGGRALIALQRNAVNDIPLGGPSFTSIQRATSVADGCGSGFRNMALTNDGRALLVAGYTQCSGFTTAFEYDTRSYALTSSPYPGGLIYEGLAGSGADGRLVYAGSNGVSPDQAITIFDALSSEYSTGNASFNLFAISVSGDASRVIFQNTSVHDRALSLLGSLPGGGVALASRDSSRAFLYREVDSAPVLEVYDLDGPLELGATFPLLDSIALESPNATAGSLSSITLAATPDDRVVFVSGDQRILTVSVD